MKNEIAFADIDNWKKADVLKLANHFHKWCPKTNQHKRVYHFEMSELVLKEFNELEEIKLINIHLALKSEKNAEQFTFYPILEIHFTLTKDIVYLPLIGFEAPGKAGTHSLSDIVPGIFKEMITRNWHIIETSLIDDLFLAKQKLDASLTGEMVRVHHFEIGNIMIKHINEIRSRGSVKGIILYPGVDMNKVMEVSMISFTPILGIKHEESEKSNAEYGVIETTKYETFIEYSSPCPPTCGSRKEVN